MTTADTERLTLREIQMCLLGAIEFCTTATNLVEDIYRSSRNGDGATANDKLASLDAAIESMSDNFRFLGERVRALLQGRAH
jgi:hypothetical protein